MELLGMEDFVVGLEVAIITSVILICAVVAIALAGIAEEEKTGHRLLWAEWPADERTEVAPEAELRKAA